MTTPNGHLDLPNAQRILCVFAPLRIHDRWEIAVAGSPIQECDWSALPAVKKLLLWKSYGQFYRDNPRGTRYMSQLVAETIARTSPQAHLDVLASDIPRDRFAPEFSQAIRSYWTLHNNRIDAATLKEIASQPYDVVVMAYPDAIGYGWGSLERSLRKLKPRAIWAINGRRRIFPLNAQYRRILRLRRVLEATWVIELIFGAALLVLGVFYALIDFPKRLVSHGR